ncbi:unnamed protein product [Rangifer tarandus platyrhynchus]|uniref:Uncharacterized protein n=1 Tax=Rangifer tarandus platyrhynchus TaxID=3082113 RepID=A0AC59ZKY9_RANTA
MLQLSSGYIVIISIGLSPDSEIIKGKSLHVNIFICPGSSTEGLFYQSNTLMWLKCQTTLKYYSTPPKPQSCIHIFHFHRYLSYLRNIIKCIRYIRIYTMHVCARSHI